MIDIKKKCNLIQGDCLEILKQIPDNSIDLILTDPPYNISKEGDNRDRSKLDSPSMRRSSSLNYDFGKWDNMDRESFLKFTEKWLEENCRVLKQNGTIISFFSKEDISFLGWVAKKYGIKTRTIFSWCKSNPVPSFRKVNYLSACEFIWFGSKGSWNFNFKKQSEMGNYMITTNSSIYGETEHPTEKPLSLLEHFIEIHSNQNDLVLDCFMGSGTTGVASLKLNRRFIGVEIDKNYFEIAKERISKWEQQTRLV